MLFLFSLFYPNEKLILNFASAISYTSLICTKNYCSVKYKHSKTPMFSMLLQHYRSAENFDDLI